jgi:hypothetical protein
MTLRCHDSESLDLRRNASKLNYIARHDGGSYLPCCERDYNIVQGT